MSNTRTVLWIVFGFVGTVLALIVGLFVYFRLTFEGVSN